MSKINVVFLSLILLAVLLEGQAGKESRKREEVDKQANGAWKENRRMTRTAKEEERERERPREQSLGRKSKENLAQIERKKKDEDGERKRDEIRQRKRSQTYKVGDEKKSNENNGHKQKDETEKRGRKESTRKEKDRNKENIAEKKRRKEMKKRRRQARKEKRNKRRKLKDDNAKKNGKTNKKENDEGRGRNRNKKNERGEKETKGNSQGEGREQNKDKKNEKGEKEIEQNTVEEKGVQIRRKSSKGNNAISTPARKEYERRKKKEDKKNRKKKEKVEDVALRFSSHKYRMAQCMVTYKMEEGDAFLMTTDDSKMFRKCDSRFVARDGHRLNFTCPVFNLAIKGCKQEKLIVKDTNTKMTFCTNDNVKLESTGNTLNVKHKRKKVKSKECVGTYVCEVSVVKAGSASTLEEGAASQPASTAFDTTTSTTSKETSTSTTRTPTVLVSSHSTATPVNDPSHPITSTALVHTSGSPTTSPSESPVLHVTIQTTDLASTFTSSPSAPQSSRTTLPSTTTFSTVAQTTKSLSQLTAAPLAPLPVTATPTTLPLPLPIPAPPAPPAPPPPPPPPAPPLPHPVPSVPRPTFTEALPPTAPSTLTVTTTAAASQDRQFCSNCGLSQITVPRIVGGQDANPGEFPWQVGVKLSWGGRCGGSLIKRRWVITAAHCYMNGFTSTTVYLGDHDRSVNEAGSFEVQAESVKVHPDFSRLTLDNDIALLKLSSPVTFSPTVAPICLAKPSEVPQSGIGITTGWGTTAWQGSTSNILQKVAVDFISNAWCDQLYFDRFDITDNMVCTYTPKKDACQGDSGGPLIIRAEDGRWVLVGVVSFGDECAKKDSPGVFTRVPNYISWIDENTPDDDC